MRTLALHTALVLLIGLAILALWQMREAVGLFGVALALAAGLEPLAERISARGVPRAAAAALAFIGLILTIAAGLAALALIAAVDLARLAESLPLWYGRMRQAMLFSGGLIRRIGLAMPLNALTAEQLGDPETARDALLGAATGAGVAAALTISVASLGFYWLADQRRIERLWLSLMPLEARARARAVWREVYHEIGVYVRGEAAIILIITVALLAILGGLGVPGASLLALAGGLAQVMPILGPPLAVLPGALAAFGQSPAHGAAALAGSVGALLFVRIFVAPRLFRAGTSPNPVLLIVLILALFQAGGVVLVLLGPPLAAAIQAAARTLGDERLARQRPAGPDRRDELSRRLDAIAADIAADHPDGRRLLDMVERARRLVETL